MKKIPHGLLQVMSEEDSAAENWRKEKAKSARRLAAAERSAKAKQNAALNKLVAKARHVIKMWPTSRLAQALNELEAAIAEYERTKSGDKR